MRNYRKRVSSETKAKHNKEVSAKFRKEGLTSNWKINQAHLAPAHPIAKPIWERQLRWKLRFTFFPYTTVFLSWRERDAKDSVANTAKSVLRDLIVRKKLLAEMKGNKNAISKTLNLSRNHFYYMSQKGSNLKVTHQLMQDAIKLCSWEETKDPPRAWAKPSQKS